MNKPKKFNPMQPMTLNAFAEICGVNRASITKSVKAGRLVADESGKIIPAEFKNVRYIRRHLLSRKRILHRTDEQRAFDESVLMALHTSGKVIQPADYEIYNPGKIKISDDIYFYLYETGVVEDGEFIPLARVSKHQGREMEVTVLPFESDVCLILNKGELHGIYIEGYNTTPLYMRRT